MSYNGHNGTHTGLRVDFVKLYVSRGHSLSNDDAQVLVDEIERLGHGVHLPRADSNTVGLCGAPGPIEVAERATCLACFRAYANR